MSKIYFDTDTYTSEEGKRRLPDKLIFNSRWYFVLKYIGVILRSRRKALDGVYDTAEWAASSWEIFNIIEHCGGRFHITGLDHVRQAESPLVFIGNHMSTLETMVLPGMIAPVMNTTYVVKESLVNHPFFGPVMRSRNPIVVSRSNTREDLKLVMERGQELLAEGISVIIFPQSTRRVAFNPKTFNTLGVKLAARAGVKVIPIALKTDFWGYDKYLKDLGPLDRSKSIHLAFGAPMEIVGSGKEENEQIVDFIISHLREWGGDIHE